MSPSTLLNSCFRILLLLAFMGCDKDPEVISGNEPPDIDHVPTILIENYINRIFIDLIGREPLDDEMEANVHFFQENKLSIESRMSLVDKLQNDTSWIEGDTSYKHAYYHRFYEMSKARMIEGDADSELNRWISLAENTIYRDSLTGDTIPQGNAISSANAQLRIENLQNVLKIKKEYKDGTIDIEEVFNRLANNLIYDMINMNTFNFINATFDNFFYRFPTNSEFHAVWEMIEHNRSAILFGKNGQNKGDCLEILTASKEFYQGLITWAYLNLLARFPNSEEVNSLLNNFYSNKNFQLVQMQIMITDEYANF